MRRMSYQLPRATVLGGCLLSFGILEVPAAETYFAPHAVHQNDAATKSNSNLVAPGSPNLLPGAASAARSVNAQTNVQPAAFQGAGASPENGGSVQQYLDELYRKEGREAPQMNIQNAPNTMPTYPNRHQGTQQIQRPQISSGSNVVPPKKGSGILSRINPFKSKQSAVPPPPPPPVNQAGYGQPQMPGQNQFNQQYNQFNGQLNNQANQFNNQANQFNNQFNNRVNQANGQMNQAAGQFNQQANQANQQAQQFGNQAQQFGNQAQQFGNQAQQFGNQARQAGNQLQQQFQQPGDMSIRPGQGPNQPPSAPPASGSQELELPALPGENAPAQKAAATPQAPTNFGPNAQRIQKAEADILKDVFSDEPEADEFEKPLPKPNSNRPFQETPSIRPNQSKIMPDLSPAREPAASESDLQDFRDPVEPAEPARPDSPKTVPNLDDAIGGNPDFNDLPFDDSLSLPQANDLPALPAKPAADPIDEPLLPETKKPTPKEHKDNNADQKMKLIQERGELRGLKGFCPVALRDDRDLQNALPEFHSVYKGRTYYFHSEEAKAAFDEAPAQYAPAASGLDVVLRKNKVLKEGSLDFALWYKDRLYLFTSQKTLEQFVATPKEFVAHD